MTADEAMQFIVPPGFVYAGKTLGTLDQIAIDRTKADRRVVNHPDLQDALAVLGQPVAPPEPTGEPPRTPPPVDVPPDAAVTPPEPTDEPDAAGEQPQLAAEQSPEMPEDDPLENDSKADAEEPRPTGIGDTE